MIIHDFTKERKQKKKKKGKKMYAINMSNSVSYYFLLRGIIRNYKKKIHL